MIIRMITISLSLVFFIGLSTEESLGQSHEPPLRLAIRSAVIVGNIMIITPVDAISINIFLRKVEIAEPDTTLEGTFVELYENESGIFDRIIVFNSNRGLADKWRRTIEDVLAPRDVEPTVRK